MTEFFISSVGCCPGGHRFHMNICSNNFKDAVLNAQNLDPYNVLWYGYDMFVWYYKQEGNEFKLMKEINMNLHIKGALLKNKKKLRLKNEDTPVKTPIEEYEDTPVKKLPEEEYEDEEDIFVPYDKLEKRKGTWKKEEINYELYKEVVYSDIEEIKITNPLPEDNKTRVYVKLPSTDKNHKKYLFMVNWGYMWEDSSDILYFKTFSNKLSNKEKEKCAELNANIAAEIKEEQAQEILARRKELTSKKKTLTDEEKNELFELKYLNWDY